VRTDFETMPPGDQQHSFFTIQSGMQKFVEHPLIGPGKFNFQFGVDSAGFTMVAPDYGNIEIHSRQNADGMVTDLVNR